MCLHYTRAYQTLISHPENEQISVFVLELLIKFTEEFELISIWTVEGIFVLFF